MTIERNIQNISPDTRDRDCSNPDSGHTSSCGTQECQSPPPYEQAVCLWYYWPGGHCCNNDAGECGGVGPECQQCPLPGGLWTTPNTLYNDCEPGSMVAIGQCQEEWVNSYGCGGCRSAYEALYNNPLTELPNDQCWSRDAYGSMPTMAQEQCDDLMSGLYLYSEQILSCAEGYEGANTGAWHLIRPPLQWDCAIWMICDGSELGGLLDMGGCMNPYDNNYNPQAQWSLCTLCASPNECYYMFGEPYNPESGPDMGEIVEGCMDPNAPNYEGPGSGHHPEANYDDGSCIPYHQDDCGLWSYSNCTGHVGSGGQPCYWVGVTTISGQCTEWITVQSYNCHCVSWGLFNFWSIFHWCQLETCHCTCTNGQTINGAYNCHDHDNDAYCYEPCKNGCEDYNQDPYQDEGGTIRTQKGGPIRKKYRVGEHVKQRPPVTTGTCECDECVWAGADAGDDMQPGGYSLAYDCSMDLQTQNNCALNHVPVMQPIGGGFESGTLPCSCYCECSIHPQQQWSQCWNDHMFDQDCMCHCSDGGYEDNIGQYCSDMGSGSFLACSNACDLWCEARPIVGDACGMEYDEGFITRRAGGSIKKRKSKRTLQRRKTGGRITQKKQIKVNKDGSRG